VLRFSRHGKEGQGGSGYTRDMQRITELACPVPLQAILKSIDESYRLPWDPATHSLHIRAD